jgi:tRNA threonylcarbamoyladenosine biosynthesis protein TsaE
MIMLELIYDLKEIKDVAEQLNLFIGNCSVVTFVGSLGAGKTTLIGALLKERNVIDSISSPTFTYVNSYKAQDGQYFFHFDLYRLDNIDQFIAAGFDEYLYQKKAMILIEWPEIIEPLLARMPHCKVTIDYVDEQRKLIAKKYE